MIFKIDTVILATTEVRAKSLKEAREKVNALRGTELKKKSTLYWVEQQSSYEVSAD